MNPCTFAKTMCDCEYFTPGGHFPNCEYSKYPHHVPSLLSPAMDERPEIPRQLPSYMKFQPWVDPFANPYTELVESVGNLENDTKTKMILEMPNESLQLRALKSSASTLCSMIDEHSTYMTAVDPRDAVLMIRSVRNSHKRMASVPSFWSMNSKRSKIETELREKKIPGLLSPVESARHLEKSSKSDTARQSEKKLNSARIIAVKKMLKFLNTMTCDEFEV